MQSYISVKLNPGLISPSESQPKRKYTSISEGRRHQFKIWTRRLLTFLCSQVGVGSIVLSYTVLGASIFVAIESPTESRRLSEVRILRDSIVGELWHVTENYNLIHAAEWKKAVEGKILNFQSSIVQEIRNGYDGSSDPIWTFPAALMYSLSVYTTIGYGNLTPRTGAGKMLTILYALFGIPLLLLYMANIGDLLATSFRSFYTSVYLCQRKLEKARRESEVEREKTIRSEIIDKDQIYRSGSFWQGLRWKRKGKRICTAAEAELESVAEESEDDSRSQDNEELEANDVAIPISTCLIVFILYVSLSSVLFSLWEGWNYLDGSYFCFVTLVTVGFGDLVPGDSREARQKREVHSELVLCTIYILFGMALMAMCFHLTQERLFQAAKKLGAAIHLI